MKKTVTREIEVQCCDFCGEEANHVEKCAFCGRDMCFGLGRGKEHIAYSLEIYRHSDGERRGSLRVCVDCAGIYMALYTDTEGLSDKWTDDVSVIFDLLIEGKSLTPVGK